MFQVSEAMLRAIFLIATAPPERARHGGNAYVPWEHVTALRDELDRIGFDWRAAKRGQGR